MGVVSSIVLISVGASLGALLRWQLGVWLSHFGAFFAWGTLLANWLGCFGMGIAMTCSLDSPYRLLLITGFLGGLTTFSAFSGELVENMLAGRYGLVLGVVLLHLVGGVLFTMVGILVVQLWQR